MNAMANALSWERDGRDWPHREASRFVSAAGLRWHVQEIGRGPVVLLLHGTGASTHTWRGLIPLLAERFHLVALDLPGHGFTQAPPREFLSLYGMGLAVHALLRQLVTTPALVIGHSAGAALAVRMCCDGHITPRLIVGINAALLPLRGLAGQVFSPLAKLMARLPLVPQLLARRAFDLSTIKTMIADTGSKLDREGVEFYWCLAQSPQHIASAFGMMAEWDLPRLQADFGKLHTPLLLIAAANDKSIRPSDADSVAAKIPGTKVVRLPELGHLAHEEAPSLIASIVIEAAHDAGILRKHG